MAANLTAGQKVCAMSSVIPLSRWLPLTLADIRDDEERVIIYCLACGRSRDMLVYLLRKMVGPISLGTVNGRFGCRGRGGCGKAVGVVLPCIAPTPEAWARLYKPKASDAGIRYDAPSDDFSFHVEEWSEKPDTRTRMLAQVIALDMAHAAFDLAFPHLARGRDKPYLVIRHQRRVLRDSRRDFKLLPGGQDS